ncbi:translation initiation factor eIF-2B subunit beta-like protein [Tanacetum coccineum]|uniref:Translation initiation factor eIF2B subunit beta n=1 Tax=Tanacetum coccineum TaxID=301880 RepID=A0ABQ5B275_9ASTR
MFWIVFSAPSGSYLKISRAYPSKKNWLLGDYKLQDSTVFAMISRVNMVIVGAHAVMANGGVIAPVGLNMVALAAQRHAVPFVVLAGCHKLFPLYPHNPEVLLNELKSPSELLDFGSSRLLGFGTGWSSSSSGCKPAFLTICLRLGVETSQAEPEPARAQARLVQAFSDPIPSFSRAVRLISTPT